MKTPNTNAFAPQHANPSDRSQPTKTVAKPISFTVGTLNNQDDIATLRRRAAAQCGKGPTLIYDSIESQVPSGGFVSQTPLAGTIYQCGMTITITSSSGPAAKVQPFPVGYLAVADQIATLQEKARALCHAGPDIVRQTANSGAPKGAYLSQMPPAAAIYQCGMGITITFSNGPAPTPWPPASVIFGGAVMILLIGGLVSWRIFPRQEQPEPAPPHLPTFEVRREGPPGIRSRASTLPRGAPDITLERRRTRPAESHIISIPLQYNETLVDTETRDV